MKKFSKKVAVAAVALAAVCSSGCSTFVSYCELEETRETLRKVNPWDLIDVVAVGACASAKVYSDTDSEGDENE